MLRAGMLALSMFLAGTVGALAQNTLRGKVTDGAGVPLAGAAVTVKGGGGATTSQNGEYSIAVQLGDALVFSFIGLPSHEATYTGQATIDVVLKENEAEVEEVVVVGYGTQKRSSLTASISQISGAELLKSPSSNISSVLGGRITGLSSSQMSGQPGADQATLSIRGSTSTPVYIVDGIYRPINDIDPSEIETVSILKDASATSIYGLGGANGVVIITTKKGAKSAPKINYRGACGVSVNASFPEFLDGPGYAYWYNKAWELDQQYLGNIPTAAQYPFTKAMVDKMLNNDDSDGWGNTDWIGETFGVGRNQQHSVSVAGGSDNSSYFASLGYMDQTGNIKNFNYDRYNLRTNLETRLGKNLTFSLGVAGQAGRRTSPGFSAGGASDTSIAASDMPWMSIAEQAIYAHPYLPKTFNGLPVASVGLSSGQRYSPIAAVEQSGHSVNQTYSVQSNLSLKWDVPWVKGLSAKFVGSYDLSTTFGKSVSTPYRVMLENLRLGTFSETVDVRGNTVIRDTESASKESFTVSQTSLNYIGSMGKHDYSAMALLETQSRNRSNIRAGQEGFMTPDLVELDVASGAIDRSVVGGNSSLRRKASLVWRGNYSYMSRYLLEFSGRYDGSDSFSGNVKGKRWLFAPAVSLGWRISEASFFEKAKSVMDNLKIRASAGRTANDYVPVSYAYLALLNSTANPLVTDGTSQTGLQVGTEPNMELTWNTTDSYNIGFDATLWKGLLGVEFDAFYNYNYDIISAAAGYPPSMGGYYPTYMNANKRDIKGFETTLSHRNTIGKEFSYGARFNMSYAYNRWLQYADSPNTYAYQQNTGKAVNTRRIMIADGLFRDEYDVQHSPYFAGKTPRPGDVKYKDLNGDGIISEADRAVAGRPTMPKLMGGFGVWASWKGFDVDLTFTGAAIFDVYLTGTYANGNDDTSVFTRPFKGSANAPRYLVEGSWRTDNTGGEFPRLSIATPDGSNYNGYASTFWARDGKYIRLKSAQLGYTFPKEWMTKIGVGSVRIYVEGSNLFTVSGLPKGVDPERPGVTQGYYPQQRVIMGGLTITL